MSEKRRDGAWTEAARNDVVACGLPEEGVVMGAAPERIEGSGEKRRDGAWTEAARNDVVACGLLEEGVVMGAAPERIKDS
jgi:hypothetical protein